LAAAVVVSAAPGAVVPREPVVPVRAQPLLLAQVPVPVPLVVARAPPEAELLVLAHLVREPAAPVELLLSRRSFSAARARSSP
jgi:hypothetical protein